MVKFLYVYLITVFVLVIEDINCSRSIADTLSRFYESELQKSLKRAWQKYKISYEHVLVTNLRENVGVFPMNVYVRHDTNPKFLAAGCYFTDNVVDVLLFGLTLREMPRLIMPVVTLAPASNLLRLEATVSKIFIDTNYGIARNDSSVVHYDPLKSHANTSPFSLEQVPRQGSLTIIAEDCFLSGFSIVTLVGTSLNIGHSPMLISDCKFTIELSASDLSIPPVIASYSPPDAAKQIESLLTKAFLAELVPKIQGSIYSFVNTTDAFGDDLNKFRLHQQKLFKQTANYMSDVCTKLNNLTLKKGKGHVQMSPLNEVFEFETDAELASYQLTLYDMMLYGLDTAHATRAGGSFEATKLSIADGIRFSSIQIRGKAKYVNASNPHLHDFAAELTDVTVNVILNMEKDGSNEAYKFKFVGWRTLDFSMLPWEVVTKVRVWYQSLVTGYLLNEVPTRVNEHLSSVLTPAANGGEESEERKRTPGKNTTPKAPPCEKGGDDEGADDNDDQEKEDENGKNNSIDKKEDSKVNDDEGNNENDDGNENDENESNDNNEEEDNDEDGGDGGNEDQEKEDENDNEENENSNDDNENDDGDNNTGDENESNENNSNENTEGANSNDDIENEENDSKAKSNTDDIKNILIFDSENNNQDGDSDNTNPSNKGTGSDFKQDESNANKGNDDLDDSIEVDNPNGNKQEDSENNNEPKVSSNGKTEDDTKNILIFDSENNDFKAKIESNNNDDENGDPNSDSNTNTPSVIGTNNDDDDDDTGNGVTSDPDAGKENDNDDIKKEINSVSDDKNILIFGNGDTKSVARIGTNAKEGNNSKTRAYVKHLGLQNKTLKGLSSKKLRSNNVRLMLTKKSNVVKRKPSTKEPIKMKMPSPHMSENELIR